MEDNPNAQGIEEKPEQVPSSGGVSPGVQARFDEMTARIHELSRGMQVKDEQVFQLTQELVRRSASSQQSPVDPVLQNIDPEDREKFGAMFKHYSQSIVEPLQQQIASLTSQMLDTRAQGALAQVQDKEVREAAQSLINGWKSKGVYGSVATEEDAVLMAEGMVARKNKGKTERANFNNSEAPLSGGRATPANPSQKKGPDLSNMSVEQIAANMREIESQIGDIEF